MDQKQLREQEARCVQENPPGCVTGCPVHVDVRGMIAAIRSGDYETGFALFHRMVPFPRIISRICDEPCRHTCKRTELDEAVRIRALEKVCTDNFKKPVSRYTAQAPKSAKVAVIGASLSGLAVAFELSRKGYKVVVFEATDCLGGSIRYIAESKLPKGVIETDFAVFDDLPVEFRYHTAIGIQSDSPVSLTSLCKEYDALYLGSGWNGINNVDSLFETDDSGKMVIDPLTRATSISNVFAGGSLLTGQDFRSPIISISDGKIAAISIDRLLQNASLTANREKEGPYATTLYTNISGIKLEMATPIGDADNGYTKEEAAREADRCLLCECRECVKACEYLAHYRSYPKKYVREVYNNLSIVMGIHHANKMINSCSLCGLCEQICPGKLNMGEVCQEARQTLVEKGKMPPSAHDFALRDMRFSTSDSFVLNRHQPGCTASSAVFYPGCQLAASAPQYVKQVYEYLCATIEGGVGLMLGCCGAPASWAGQEALFQETVQEVKQNWRDLGSPTVITACPSCTGIFTHTLPEIQVEPLWTVLNRIGLPNRDGFRNIPRKLAVHDSCTTRHEQMLQDSVRDILAKLGHQIEELSLNRSNTVCCGYGGLMIYANREIAHKVINRRIEESDSDYLVYCAMCRDNLASQGKRVYHLLDLVFERNQETDAAKRGPGYSERQANRAMLKRLLLREVWGETVEAPEVTIKVIISDSVRQVLDDRMILVEDVIKVIIHAEGTGDKLKNTETGRYIAYHQPGCVTYWVEYSPEGDCFLVHNAYSHRIEISD